MTEIRKQTIDALWLVLLSISGATFIAAVTMLMEADLTTSSGIIATILIVLSIIPFFYYYRSHKSHIDTEVKETVSGVLSLVKLIAFVGIALLILGLIFGVVGWIVALPATTIIIILLVLLLLK